MKKIIDGKTYNTKTAIEIADYSNGLSVSDFGHVKETLYVTKKGAYFLAGSGGAMTKYAKTIGNMMCDGEGIEPLTEKEALVWLESHDETDAIERYFSDMIEDA